jgi:starch synthase
MRILQVASEAVPVCKTGGLADVVAALSRALVSGGDDVGVLLPAYRGVLERTGAKLRHELGDPLGTGHAARLWSAELGDTGALLLLLQCDPLYDRDGGPYGDVHGIDWPDNHLRFALLSRVAAQLAIASPVLDRPVDLVHAHDWQAALCIGHLAWWGAGRPATVFTVHNLHFAGRFPQSVVRAIGAPASAWSPAELEFYGEVSLLKAGLVHADRVTTVSPTYADEIRTPAGGIGFDGLLRWRGDAVQGVLNGIDTHVWDPSGDPALAVHYDAQHLDDKTRLRAALQRELDLSPQDHAPIFGVVSRLTWQKGLDLLLEAWPAAQGLGAQLVVLGSGEPGLEQAITQLALQHPGRVAFVRGYDDALSHRIFAGVDVLCVPSRFEPCGLTQMYAMRYGTPPLVRHTGGLADTVTDDVTGFVFGPPSAAACADALVRATVAYEDRDRFRAMQRRAMAEPHDWSASADEYRRIYREAIAVRGATP